MERQWSGKKVLLIWSAIIAVIVCIITITHFFPIPDIAANIVGYVIGGVAVLFTILVTLALLGWVIYGMVVWIRARQAKSRAYDMIECGRIYPEWFKKVVSVLEEWGGREARHLLNHLYELEQIPDKEEDEDEDEKEAKRQAERQQSFANVSTEELLALKDNHKSNKSVVKIIDDILEARTKVKKND